MSKAVTGQYECVHSSGIGLDYFTSRIDRLTLFPSGRFTLITQERSRIVNAAQSLISGQQVTPNAPETRREGSYTIQGNIISLRFDDGSQEQGQLAWNGEGLQLDKDFFNKVSDSTVLPPAQRLKKDMDDIAKGLKIAGTIGGMAMKAAKTIHETIQATQESGTGSTQSPAQPSAQGSAPPAASHPVQPAQPATPAPPSYASTPPAQQPASPVEEEPLYCDQCGTRARPGKRYCGKCGALLP